jgi:hypothetical protein
LVIYSFAILVSIFDFLEGFLSLHLGFIILHWFIAFGHYSWYPQTETVLLVLPAPKEGQVTTIAVLTAEPGMSGSKSIYRGVFATRTPAAAQYVNVIVPPARPVTVTDTGRPAVAPDPVIINPER